MSQVEVIPIPIMFNPFKHHLSFIKKLISESNYSELVFKEIISHAGTSVTDIYTGDLEIDIICSQVIDFLVENSLNNRNSFCFWPGNEKSDYRKIILPDNSEWTLKFFDNPDRFVHLFPARNSINTCRAKGSSLKTAVLWSSQVSYKEININNLNQIRKIAGLSPIKSLEETKALSRLIDLLS
jgi:hypothetical protein